MHQRSVIRDILTEYRTLRGLSLRSLSEIVDVSFSYLAKIERQEIQPSREIVIQIADKLNMSRYNLLIAAGYAPDIKTEVKTRYLSISYQEVAQSLITHRVYALRQLKEIREEKKIDILKVAKDLTIEFQRYKEIESIAVSLTLDEIVDVCLYFDVEFYKVFQVKKANYNGRYKGIPDEEDVAMQLHQYIENHKKEKHQLMIADQTAIVKEVSIDYNSTLREEALNLISNITSDEINYLRECLLLYRKMNLKPTKNK